MSAPLASAAFPVNRSQAWLRSAGIVLFGSALVALCARVSLPLYFTPVPLSMQPFAVMLLGLLLSPRLAAATLGAYLLEGAIGLPVFAPGAVAAGGLAHLFGPTGGYLLSYPVAAPLISILYRRLKRSFTAALVGAGVGSLVTLACGALWFVALTHASLQLVLMQTVLPFLPGDALKVAGAAGIVAGVTRIRIGKHSARAE